MTKKKKKDKKTSYVLASPPHERKVLLCLCDKKKQIQSIKNFHEIRKALCSGIVLSLVPQQQCYMWEMDLEVLQGVDPTVGL